ncbi:hypothetical protein C7271_16615 [filamentous cyanobacterium CCP5]|nr:hypothetical protein C7271_16615 [filamentous cyanobacterium CCP5]
MFIDELSPLFRECVSHPAAFLGGLASGLLRIDLSDDPVKTWLENQGAAPAPTSPAENNGNGGGPQSISID